VATAALDRQSSLECVVHFSGEGIDVRILAAP
jgi:hypothetical protein